MFHTIASVVPLPGLRLLARFHDGQDLEYDLTPLLTQIPAFRALESEPGLFEQVRVDTGGYGVSWDDGLDLSSDEIFAHGKPVTGRHP